MKTAYTYTVLRYVHDTATGEFVNVGVALYSPTSGYAGAICRPTYSRLSKFFPGLQGEWFKSLMRYVQSTFETIGDKLRNELSLEVRPQNVMEVALKVVPMDDSSLQWSPMGSGITDNPSAVLEKIYNRMVEAYDREQIQTGRTDEVVWRKYRKDLEDRHVLSHLCPKTIVSQSQDDEFEFQRAWKNQQWHCVEAVSFDLMDPEAIKAKALRWLGQISSIQDSAEPFKAYFLLGEPQFERLKPAFVKAQNILHKMPGQKEFVREDDSALFAERFAADIHQHLAEEKAGE